MDKMLKFLKLIKGVAGLIIGILVVVFVLNFLRDKTQPNMTLVSNGEDYKLIETTYREPIASLPWQKSKEPIKKEKLPIPKKNVDKVIQIETKAQGSDEVIITEIIIDKKGDVYKALDTPGDTKIKVTKYKPSLIAFDLRFGYTLAVSDGIYHCLTLDYLRVDRFYLGSEIGLHQSKSTIGDKYLIGLSLKYRIAKDRESGVNLSLTAGWNLVGNKVYGGLTIKW